MCMFSLCSMTVVQTGSISGGKDRSLCSKFRLCPLRRTDTTICYAHDIIITVGMVSEKVVMVLLDPGSISYPRHLDIPPFSCSL